jgi:hypothetical protein
MTIYLYHQQSPLASIQMNKITNANPMLKFRKSQRGFEKKRLRRQIKKATNKAFGRLILWFLAGV